MELATKKVVVEVAKGAVGVVGGISSGYVVDNIVKALLPPPAKPFGKMVAAIGQGFLSGALADAGVNSACETIDTIADIFLKTEEEGGEEDAEEE